MATATLTQSVSGTQVKAALTFLKKYRNKGPGPAYMDGVAVEGKTWRVGNYVIDAVVPAPLDLPNGIYTLFDVMPALTAAPVRIEWHDEQLRVNGVPIHRVEEILPDVGVGSRTIKLGPIPTGWEMLQNHASREEYRAVLQGIHLDVTQGVAVGTDGARLASVAWDAVRRLPSSILLRNVPFKPQGATLTVTYDKAKRPVSVVIATPRGDIHANPIEGRFPDWASVIPDPATCPLTAQIDPQMFAEWAKQNLALSKTARVPVVDIIRGTVDLGPGHVANVLPFLSLCENITVQDATGEAWRGGVGTILINPEFVWETAIRFPKGAPITVRFSGSQHPVIFASGGLRSIILPIRDLTRGHAAHESA